jgi:hypothetical protein
MSMPTELALAAIKGDKTLAELVHQYEVHAAQITTELTRFLEVSNLLVENGGDFCINTIWKPV